MFPGCKASENFVNVNVSFEFLKNLSLSSAGSSFNLMTWFLL